ncbi:hypothetical protein [Cohnella silvisoli]|uniref:DUF4362 domain-containing protein n=1 Tax=Cohnella silvisoli TaxID=2873699 RepID=A0ABV1KR77_9BACL|nr:hypothetical protein [Cohnella silvisoli]MCD9021749.1 hypothetical protein [Cohnella silvisoli]
MKSLLCLICAVLILTGCNSVQNVGDTQSIPTVESAKVNAMPSSSPVEGLEAIQQTINEHWKEIGRRQSIALQSSGAGKDSIEIVIRSFGDFERILSKADIGAFKKSLFELAGKEFPLELSVLECCTGKPNVTGKITDVDTEENRILVINEKEKNGDSDDPVADWVGLTEDGKVFADGLEISSIFDSSLIGKEVKA